MNNLCLFSIIVDLQKHSKLLGYQVTILDLFSEIRERVMILVIKYCWKDRLKFFEILGCLSFFS